MKTYMKKIQKTFQILTLAGLLVLFANTYVKAQIGGPGGDPEGGGAPIDGGISLLVAAGVGYGIKKVYNKRREQKV
jgi:hypothetical protein